MIKYLVFLIVLILGCVTKKKMIYYNPLTVTQMMNPKDSLIIIERNDSLIISTIPRHKQ